MKNLSAPFFALVIFATLSSTQAALVFEKSEVDLKPAITDQTAVAHFKYTNTGDKPVKIVSVKPSCGCTTAEPPKDPVGPGASGEIVATFNIGQRMGAQTKTITVQTDSPNDPAIILTLHATIPTLLEVQPTFLYWSRLAPRDPRTIEAKVGQDFPVTKLDVTCTDAEVKFETTPGPDHKIFRIKITPPDSTRPISAQLKITPDFPKEKPKTYNVYLRIDAPAARPTPTSPPPQ
jgi:hypothetical protein